jgi:rubrerythrin
MTESQETLLRNFIELKSMERQAYNLYQKILPVVTEVSDKKILEAIMDDELRHEKMVQGVLDILQDHA